MKKIYMFPVLSLICLPGLGTMANANDLTATNYASDQQNLSASAINSFSVAPNRDEQPLVENFFRNNRIKTEVAFINTDASESTVASRVSKLGIMANSFYDFSGEGNLQPYVGFGAGIANLTVENGGYTGARGNESFTLPAYQAMAGVAYKSETYSGASAHLGYKYFATVGRPEENNNIEPALRDSAAQNIEAGVRLVF